MKDRLISFIIPIFNIDKYLEKCINSVLNQTYTNFEIILVDDGSTDHSPEICDNYSIYDERIRVVHKKNEGSSAARNAGLDIANGDFIIFLDGDDEIGTNDTIEKNIHVFDDRNYDFIQFPIIKNINNVLQIEKDFYKYPIPIRTFKDFIYNYSPIYKGNIIDGSVCNKIFKKEIFKYYRFQIGRIHEDGFLLNDICKKYYRLYVTNYGFYKYNIRSNSMNTSAKSCKWVYDLLLMEIGRTILYRTFDEYKEFYTLNVIHLYDTYRFYAKTIDLSKTDLKTQIRDLCPSFHDCILNLFHSPKNGLKLILLFLKYYK